jgi:hypothetical protein
MGAQVAGKPEGVGHCRTEELTASGTNIQLYAPPPSRARLGMQRLTNMLPYSPAECRLVVHPHNEWKFRPLQQLSPLLTIPHIVVLLCGIEAMAEEGTWM